MARPDWFILLDQWMKKGRGEFGPTLPYIIGAIAYRNGQTQLNIEHVQKMIDEIAYNPVEGYYTEVRCCPDIDAPVFNTRKINWPYKLASEVEFVPPSSENKSIVFSQNIQSSFHFDTSNPDTLLDRLVQHATEPVSKGMFSRCRAKDGMGCEFKEFSENDLEYIRNTICPPNHAPNLTRKL